MRVRVNRVKMIESGIKSKENGTWPELAGEFELPGFYCITNILSCGTIDSSKVEVAFRSTKSSLVMVVWL